MCFYDFALSDTYREMSMIVCVVACWPNAFSCWLGVYVFNSLDLSHSDSICTQITFFQLVLLRRHQPAIVATLCSELNKINKL